VGEISERVVVQGEAPLVETTQSALSGLVDDKKIRDLPLNGHSFEQLALLQTGITVYRRSTQTAQNGAGTKMSIAESRPSRNNFILDGVTINDSGNSTPGSAAGNNLGVEAIREFKVLTNSFSAAYGKSSGGVISVVTKSGTNDLHGSVFAFHRNSALDAKNFFDDPNEDIPSFKRNQFGFTLGGPIVKDTTFIFGHYEGLRESLGVSFVGIVPNTDARQGILPGFDNPGQTKTITVHPAMGHYLTFHPLPNGRDFEDGTGKFFHSPNHPTTEDYFTLRLDHQFSDKNLFFACSSFDQADIEKPEVLGVFADFSFSRYQSLALELKTILSPTLINTVRFGGNRTFA
jgi:hypothetical protein